MGVVVRRWQWGLSLHTTWRFFELSLWGWCQMDGLYTLYTVQKPGFAITLRQYASPEFLDAGMAFHSMLFRMTQDAGPDVWQQLAQHLGWKRWISCFQDISDYDNYWIALENLTRGDLWTLNVPPNEVYWCSLEAQCENQLPVEKWFCKIPEAIRRHGQTPQAFIPFPIKPAWLAKAEPAKAVFEDAGLWDERLEASSFDELDADPVMMQNYGGRAA